MSTAPPDSCGRTFRYTSIACEILVFAIVGWLIGPYVFGPNGDVLGMFIGAVVGTLMMFLTLCYLAGLYGQKREKGKQQVEN